MVLTTLAGLPAAIENGGMSLVTTAPAATIEPVPIVTPFRTMADFPSQTLSPMVTGLDATLSVIFQLGDDGGVSVISFR